MLYHYQGPRTAMTLPDGREALLCPGTPIDLPDDNEVVQTLVAMGRLVPADAPAPTPARKPSPSKTITTE